MVHKPEHTLGPWVRVNVEDYAEIQPAGNRTRIALVGSLVDADLIAAAPETAAERDQLKADLARAMQTNSELAGKVEMLDMHLNSCVIALRRAESKLKAYVGVCKDDKELTGTVLPLCQNALLTVRGENG